MARRAAPANRLLIEGALHATRVRDGSTMLDVLDSMAAALGVEDPADWQESQLLAVLFETVAATTMIDQLVKDGAPLSDAVLTTAARLGLDPATLRARLRHRRPVPAQGAA